METRAYRYRYGFVDYYEALVLGFRSMPRLLRNKRRKLVDPKLVERIMLAVTEVNGCAVCSYAHTGIALKQGLAPEEIQSFLSGSKDFVKAEEAEGILFAQHYASTNGRPDPAAYRRTQRTYGPERTRTILAAIQMMMVGNISGLPTSAMLSRFRGKPYRNSSLAYELLLPLSTLLFLVPALIHALLSSLLRRPAARFAAAEAVSPRAERVPIGASPSEGEPPLADTAAPAQPSASSPSPPASS